MPRGNILTRLYQALLNLGPVTRPQCHDASGSRFFDMQVDTFLLRFNLVRPRRTFLFVIAK